jgi:hypothetical protein
MNSSTFTVNNNINNNNTDGVTNTSHSRPLHTNHTRRTINNDITNNNDFDSDASSSDVQQQQLGADEEPMIITNIEELSTMRPLYLSNNRRVPHYNGSSNHSSSHGRLSYVDTMTLEMARSQHLFQNMTFLVFLLSCLTLILLPQLICASMVVAATTVVFGHHIDAKKKNHLHFLFSSCWLVVHGIDLLHLVLSPDNDD